MAGAVLAWEAAWLRRRTAGGYGGAAPRLGHGDLGGGTRQPVAARLAAGGGHHAGATQVADQLLDVRMRQLLRTRDGRQRPRLVALGVGKRDEHPDPVLGARGELHGSSTTTASPSRRTA